MKKFLFVIMIACLTVVGTINANVSSAVSSASYYELEDVEENEYGENFTFVRGKSPVHLKYTEKTLQVINFSCCSYYFLCVYFCNIKQYKI